MRIIAERTARIEMYLNANIKKTPTSCFRILLTFYNITNKQTRQNEKNKANNQTRTKQKKKPTNEPTK